MESNKQNEENLTNKNQETTSADNAKNSEASPAEPDPDTTSTENPEASPESDPGGSEPMFDMKRYDSLESLNELPDEITIVHMKSTKKNKNKSDTLSDTKSSSSLQSNEANEVPTSSKTKKKKNEVETISDTKSCSSLQSEEAGEVPTSSKTEKNENLIKTKDGKAFDISTKAAGEAEANDPIKRTNQFLKGEEAMETIKEEESLVNDDEILPDLQYESAANSEEDETDKKSKEEETQKLNISSEKLTKDKIKEAITHIEQKVKIDEKQIAGDIDKIIQTAKEVVEGMVGNNNDANIDYFPKETTRIPKNPENLIESAPKNAPKPKSRSFFSRVFGKKKCSMK